MDSITLNRAVGWGIYILMRTEQFLQKFICIYILLVFCHCFHHGHAEGKINSRHNSWFLLRFDDEVFWHIFHFLCFCFPCEFVCEDIVLWMNWFYELMFNKRMVSIQKKKIFWKMSQYLIIHTSLNLFKWSWKMLRTLQFLT